MITTQQTRRARNGLDATYEVRRDGRLIGTISKFRGADRSWKCYAFDGKSLNLFRNVETGLGDAVKAIVGKDGA